jgi:hypothetical protein
MMFIQYYPCGLYTVNDSFIYVASWHSLLPSTPVSILIYSNNTWNFSPLLNTTPLVDETIFQTTVVFGLTVTGFVIRIFDLWGHSLLYQ